MFKPISPITFKFALIFPTVSDDNLIKSARTRIITKQINEVRTLKDQKSKQNESVVYSRKASKKKANCPLQCMNVIVIS